MPHDHLAAEPTADGGIAARCSCGSWECAGPTAHSVAAAWDHHRRSTEPADGPEPAT